MASPEQPAGLTGVGAVEVDRDGWRRQDVEEQPGDMTLENFGDLAWSCQPRVVSGCTVQANHDIPDHGDLTFRQRATANLI